MQHIIDQLAHTIREAVNHKTPLCIRGGGTKDFYGGAQRGEMLGTAAYRGVVDYEPSELVLTARAGTPLTEIESALRDKGQMLAFEPPHFGALPSPQAILTFFILDFVDNLGVRIGDFGFCFQTHQNITSK
jgi:glycolate oxidase FAD binding subunit